MAGIGRAQLEVLNDRIAARRNIFNRYFEELSNHPGFTFMPELHDTFSNRWLTALVINEKEAGVSVAEILTALGEENIEARPVWKPLHLQPVFNNYKYYPHSEQESISEELFQNGVCLPSGSNMTEEEIERVINCIRLTVKEREILELSNR